jgi:hypothetical protein
MLDIGIHYFIDHRRHHIHVHLNSSVDHLGPQQRHLADSEGHAQFWNFLFLSHYAT